MATVALALRIVLAAVFLTAGVGKLLDLGGSRKSMRDFGVPERLAGAAGLLLPIAEIVVALGLIARPSAQIAAAGALVLLLLFIAGIANALRQGIAPDCNCFGQIHSAPAGRETLVRNSILAALALVALAAGPGPAVDTWIRDHDAAVIVAVASSAIAIGLAIWSFQLWTALRRFAKDLSLARKQLALVPAGLPVGAKAPDFSLKSVDGGNTVTLSDLRAEGQPVLLMFTAPRCGPCSEIFPTLRRWQQSLAHQLTVALVSTGRLEDNEYLVEEHGLEHLLVQETVEAADAYRIRSTPSAVLISGDGKIATSTAQSIFEIEPMVRHALRGGDLAAVSA